MNLTLRLSFLLAAILSFQAYSQKNINGDWANCKTIFSGSTLRMNVCAEFTITKDYISIRLANDKYEYYYYERTGELLELKRKSTSDESSDYYIDGSKLKILFVRNKHFRELNLIDEENNTIYILAKR